MTKIGNLLEVLTLSPDKFKVLKQVYLDGNPLTLYPDKCKQSWSKMKEFIQVLNRRSIDGIFKKLQIIGDKGSGKTYLSKALQKKYFKSSTEYAETGFINTAQVTIQQDDAQDVTLNVWDMGGEESEVRNFFITSRAVYVLCFDPTKPTALERLSFWLQLVQSLCKASLSDPSNNELITPVFIVAISDDEYSSDYISEQLDLNSLIVKLLFRGFQGIYSVCRRTGRGLKELIESIVVFIKRQVGARSGISENWILLNDCLNRMKRKKVSYLDWNQFEALAKKCKIKKSVLPACAGFLRDAGTLLLFDSAANFGEHSIIILDPQWLYTLLLYFFRNSEYIKNGFLAPNDVPNLLSDYPSFIQEFVINLLSQFNVLHKLSDHHYLIPSMVTQSRPHSELRSKWPSVIEEIEHHRIFEFSFLPFEFFSRVIVRLLLVSGVHGVLFWKNGVLFELSSQNCIQKSILTYDENKYKLYIRVRVTQTIDDSGSFGMLFRHVIEVVEVLLESYYPRLVQSTQRLIPCTHCIARSAISPYLFPYVQCIESVTSGILHLYCNEIRSESRKVSLIQLAPDVAFVDLPQINENDLEIGNIVGEGSFGFVYAGKLNGKKVAIKTLKPGHGEEERAHFWEFQQESCVMR